ncbi:MAG: EAL domain-containing protein [Richelia sp.]|nr:EAL domain-containing protein [Richelia sp.]
MTEDNDKEKISHILVVKDIQGQRVITLQETTYSLGRDSRNSINLRARSVSRQHAILLRVTVPDTEQYGFRVVDGNFHGKPSTNGLLVNGRKCVSHDLKHGDIIEFGSNQAKAIYYAICDVSGENITEDFTVDDVSELLLEQANSINPFDTLISLGAQNSQGSSDIALARLASFPELIPNPIIEMSLAGTVTYMNPAANLKFPNLRKEGQQHPILAALSISVTDDKASSFIREVQVGQYFFEQSVHYIPESDLIRTFLISDITERKRAESELLQRVRLLKAVADGANYLLAEMNYDKALLQTLGILGEAANVDRVYLFENHPHSVSGDMAVSLKYEWSRDTSETKITRTHWYNQAYENSGLNRWYNVLSEGNIIRGAIADFPPGEQEFLLKDDIQSLILVPLRLENQFWGYLGLADCVKQRQWNEQEESTLITMAANISNVWQRQQVEDIIRHQALHDMLTGLPNRSLFNQQLAYALPNASRNQESLAVMFLDLDKFKMINDTLGHSLGDKLLQDVAYRLRECLRAGDVVARWGGDEFTILLPRVKSLDEVTQLAARILESLDKVFHIEGNELFISGSVGIALLDEYSPDDESLIKHADAALYYAKEQGRNNYQFYTTSLGCKNPELLSLEKSLRYALERNELVVYYQPKVDIATSAVTGMEALLRWQHPDMGLIYPSTFIPIAEENGWIVPIGEWVLRTACEQNKAWQEAGLPTLTMAVNLAPKQFRQPELLEMVGNILAETGLEPQYLELEITESTAIDDIGFTQKILRELENMGVHLSIDDFGTAYSSLSRLQLLPLHNLKIDRSFIKELTNDAKMSHIIKAIATLGQSLGLKITAEGVEKQEELEFLRSINCESVQGYLFYRPLSAQQATDVLHARASNASPIF